MPCYSFSIQDADGSDREYVGRMALRDDDEARAFGIAIIWDMRDAATLYEGCTMHVADGKRRVSTFSLNAADRASASRLPSADAPFRWDQVASQSDANSAAVGAGTKKPDDEICQ
jgi:hypothetical protein